MPATMRLTVITGPHKDKRFCFRGHSHCLVGRSPDCFVQLCGADRDRLISRKHCELSIDPPCVRVNDLGSANGTFLNGKEVSKLEQSIVDVLANRHADGVEVDHGDIITIGGTSLRVDIVDCPPQGIAVDDVWKTGETTKKNCLVDC